MESKPFYTSKTFWAALCVAVAPAISAAFPPAGVWLAANSDWVCTGLGVAFGALRAVSNQPISR
jgi:hypothetical protein